MGDKERTSTALRFNSDLDLEVESAAGEGLFLGCFFLS